ncbi:hypothetical protein KDN32_10295 [Nocardioides sp. J2M5]|uniref:hypothetical protein n=1 Tax=Nocardioides palaemonis TaxID=2829810 RepID=UPI001BA495DB|nr:hypothetical protein [Nocardioides palaemonis]MBS2938133.1 hypothetical protein [Nocardioides palaemonis]
MTGMLQDLLHERADEAGAPHVDLASITRDGERRVRHRRTAVLGGLTAAAVSVVAGVALLGGGPSPSPDSGRDRLADGTDSTPVALSWVEGTTLHRAGQPDVDLGVEVRAWVWAGDDVVFTDPDLRVRVWSGDALDVVGEVAKPPSDEAELVADGTRVAWADPQGRPVRLDVSTGEVVTGPRLPGRDLRVTAIDGAVVYAAGSGGVHVWQPTSPDGFETLVDDARGTVIDAEGGTLVRETGDREARVTGPGGRVLTLATDGFANLSPDGSHVASESDDTGVLLDTDTGAQVTLDTGFAWALPYQWLDDDTVVVLAFSGLDSSQDEVPHLLTCEVPTGACGDAVTLPSTFQLPIGIHLEP